MIDGPGGIYYSSSGSACFTGLMTRPALAQIGYNLIVTIREFPYLFMLDRRYFGRLRGTVLGQKRCKFYVFSTIY